TGEELRAIEPTLSDGVKAGVVLRDQWFINPPEYAESLADAVRERGGTITADFDVVDVRDTGSGAEVVSASGEVVSGDAVVIATGAWMRSLARKFGVK